MKCLALDTTTNISSIAVADESKVWAQYEFAHQMDLSRRLMPNIVNMLKEAGLGVKDVEAIGVSLGPGSFTGLRIGVVTAKTLAQVLNVPVVGIVALDLLAHQFDYLPHCLVCPIIKVRRGEVYWAFFQTGGGSLERVSDYAAGGVDEVIHTARGFLEKEDACGTSGVGREILFCGDGVSENIDAIRQALGGSVIRAPAWLEYPKAGILARLAINAIQTGKAADPFTLLPFYIRRSAPEMRMDPQDD